MNGYSNPIEIARSVDRGEAEAALKILNWYFDDNPETYLIQKPRVVYDTAGSQKTTVRYYMKQKEQDPPAPAEPKEERESNHEANDDERTDQRTV